jgi:hypothetical protein
MNTWPVDVALFVGSSYRVIDTPLGSRVLVLGYIYNFDQNADNTIIVNMTSSLKQPYFQEAMVSFLPFPLKYATLDALLLCWWHNNSKPQVLI